MRPTEPPDGEPVLSLDDIVETIRSTDHVPVHMGTVTATGTGSYTTGGVCVPADDVRYTYWSEPEPEPEPELEWWTGEPVETEDAPEDAPGGWRVPPHFRPRRGGLRRQIWVI